MRMWRHLIPTACFTTLVGSLRLHGRPRACTPSRRPSRANASEVLVPLVGGLDFCFDSCALVGTSADLLGRAHGAEIDSHDTVIRVNRLPSPDFFADFGTRTDVYFAEPGMRMLGKVSYSTTFLGGADFNGSPSWCSFRSGGLEGNLSVLKLNTSDGVPCPAASIVFKGTDSEGYNLTWEERFPEEAPGWNLTASEIPLWHQSSRINGAVRLFPGLMNFEPTSGFQALMTFGPICSSLTLYGFTGGSTGDNHNVSSQHDLSLEHFWLRRLEQGGDTYSHGAQARKGSFHRRL